MSGGHVNANRKHDPDPLMVKPIRLPESMWKQIDAIRGKQTRAGYIRDAIKQALYYEGLEVNQLLTQVKISSKEEV